MYVAKFCPIQMHSDEEYLTYSINHNSPVPIIGYVAIGTLQEGK